MRSSFSSIPAVMVLATLGWSAQAVAQDAGQRVTDLNRKAVDAYENLDMEEAARYLRQALEVCAAEGLNNRAKARTHIHLGMVLVGGFKQRDRGIQQFKRALEIDPSIGLTKTLINPEIQAAFDETRREMAAVAGTPSREEPTRAEGGTPGEPDSARVGSVAASSAAGQRRARIAHAPITAARSRSPINLQAMVDPALAHDKVVLAYRSDQTSGFVARDMARNRQGVYVAEIPEPATRGSAVSYYIEARNRTGQTLAAAGSPTAPYVVNLSESEEPSPGRNAPVAVVRQGRRSGRAEAGGAPREHKYWLSLGLGSGFGWARGTPEVNSTDKLGNKIELTGAFVPARLLHFAPEVGLFVGPNLLLSLAGRVQVVTSTTEVRDPSCPDQKQPGTTIGVCPPARWAVAVLGKATWLLGAPARLRPFVSLSAGAGEIRHVVEVPLLNDCGANQRSVCQDTLLGGLILVGPGLGLAYDLGRAVSAVLSVNSLVGLPNPTVNFDLNLGVAFGL
jgi:hypothetical protein